MSVVHQFQPTRGNFRRETTDFIMSVVHQFLPTRGNFRRETTDFMSVVIQFLPT